MKLHDVGGAYSLKFPALFSFEKYLLYVFFFLVFVGFSPFSVNNDLLLVEETGVSDVFRQLSFITVFLLSFVVARNIRWTASFRYRWPLYLLVVVSIVSVFWSYLPLYTLRRSFLLVILVFTVFVLMMAFDRAELLKLLYRFLAVMMVVSLIGVLVFPGAKHSGFGVVDEALLGSWKGVFSHKNQAGPISYVLFLMSIKYYFYERRFLHLMIAIAALVFILGAYSKTTIILSLPVVILAAGLSMYHKSVAVRSAFLLSVVICFLGLLYVLVGIAFLGETYGFEADAITGRGAIWSVVFAAVADNPFLGMGYGSVWLVGENSPLQGYIYGFSDWIYLVAHSHNGYLESLVSLGFLGLLILVLFFVVIPGWMIVYRADLNFGERFFYAGFWLFFWLHNMVETDVINSADPRWIMVIMMYLSITDLRRMRC